MNLKNIITVLKRELGGYFNSAVAYVYLIAFIAINNALFMTQFFLVGRADMDSFFVLLPYVLLIFIPAITMRLWAEDRKENTFELLLTFPMKPVELVLGKFLASLTFYIISLVSTFGLPLILFISGSPDVGTIISGYLGVLMLGALFMSMGIFISGLTKEQVIAFVITSLSCFLILLLGMDFLASFFDGWLPGLGSFMKNYVGAIGHLASFSRGVIDVKDFLYFVTATFVFLLLNGFYFEGRLRPKANIVFGSVVAICLAGLILFNWLVHDLPLGRFDITENKIYTVSGASKKILAGLKAPVQVNFYITPADKMPTAIKTLEQEIVGKLDELRIASKNKLNFKVFYIEAAKLLEAQQQNAQGRATPSNSLEQTLQEKGIVPFQVESIDKDALGVRLVYSAITISYLDKNEEVIQSVLPQNIPDLEYLLLSRIVKLTTEKKPKIALFSPIQGAQLSPEIIKALVSMGKPVPSSQYIDVFQSLESLIKNNGYEYERISLSKESPIPEGVGTLLILDPESLNDRQLYEINKFLYQGGSVLIAAEGYDYSFQMVAGKGLDIFPRKLDLSINRLIQQWGVSINDLMLMDEDCQIINISSNQNMGPFTVTTPIKIPNQILVRQQLFNNKAAVMNRLSALFYLWGSSLNISDEAIKSANLKKTLLFTSSPRSWLVPYENGMIKGESFEFPKTGSPGKFPLGVILQGQFSDTFNGATIADSTQAGGVVQKAELLVNPKPGKLVIIGCSKMFSDQVIGSGSGNLGLFANIVDSFSISDDLIQIRSKSVFDRSIKKLTDSQKVLYRFIAVAAIPIIWVIYAYIRLLLRRKEKQFYLAARSQ
ncbi:MAG: Gldg family protein [Candidatus Omnitrophica bacterium]|nr:Gldg family protein [Candidatus Omnitrophota bacterium]